MREEGVDASEAGEVGKAKRLEREGGEGDEGGDLAGVGYGGGDVGGESGRRGESGGREARARVTRRVELGVGRGVGIRDVPLPNKPRYLLGEISSQRGVPRRADSSERRPRPLSFFRRLPRVE